MALEPDVVILILGSCVANYLFGRYLVAPSRSGASCPARPGDRNVAPPMPAPPHRRRRRQPRACSATSSTPAFLAGTSPPSPAGRRSSPRSSCRSASRSSPSSRSPTSSTPTAARPSEYHFTDYLLFVTFFPQLIAGPDRPPPGDDAAVQRQHHGASGWHRTSPVGLTHPRHRPVQEGRHRRQRRAASPARLFALAAAGERDLTMVEAWAGALAYALQIYFDFSGYSDMAIGVGAAVRHPPAAQLPLALQGRLDHRLLAPLAHHAVALPARLPLHPARRQPQGQAAPLRQPHGHHAARRPLARRRLDLRCSGARLHGLYLCVNHGWFCLRKKLRLPAAPEAARRARSPSSPSSSPGSPSAPAASNSTARLDPHACAATADPRLDVRLNGFDGWPDQGRRVVSQPRPARLPALLACLAAAQHPAVHAPLPPGRRPHRSTTSPAGPPPLVAMAAHPAVASPSPSSCCYRHRPSSTSSASSSTSSSDPCAPANATKPSSSAPPRHGGRLLRAQHWINPWRVTPTPWTAPKLEPYRAIETPGTAPPRPAWSAPAPGTPRSSARRASTSPSIPRHPVFDGMRCANLGLNAGCSTRTTRCSATSWTRENPATRRASPSTPATSPPPSPTATSPTSPSRRSTPPTTRSNASSATASASPPSPPPSPPSAARFQDHPPSTARKASGSIPLPEQPAPPDGRPLPLDHPAHGR